MSRIKKTRKWLNIDLEILNKHLPYKFISYCFSSTYRRFSSISISNLATHKSLLLVVSLDVFHHYLYLFDASLVHLHYLKMELVIVDTLMKFGKFALYLKQKPC